MKQHSFIILFLFQIAIGLSQTSLEQIDLSYGTHSVGFYHYLTSDSTRTYSRIYNYDHQIMSRQIPISVWYPSDLGAKDKNQMSVEHYFEVLKEEEEWEYLPNEQLLNWFYYQNSEANQKHLKEQTTAWTNVEFKKGKFPVILYTPSFQASSVENFALCEYLASHGYIVLSSPSRGTENRWMDKRNELNMETQARDVEFLMGEAARIAAIDFDKMAVLGFSFGGLSDLIVQMRNERIKAIVSLDGTERYQDMLVKKSPFYDPLKIDVPYLHMAQKNIPEQVLIEDDIDVELNTKFDLFDRMIYSKRYKLKFHHLTHSYFSTMGVLFENRDPRQDRSDSEIMRSYRRVCEYSLQFLNAYLKKDKDAMVFMDNDPKINGVKADMITVEKKSAKERPISFSDFNQLARLQRYNDLDSLFESVKQNSPALELPEGDLNTLGLQLVFDPKTSKEGIRVLLFATGIYPNSANLFDSLAEAYLFLGSNEEAIESFEKSLELNAQNQNAIHRLKQLRE